LVSVVDFLDFDAGGDCVWAVGAGEGGDGVFAEFEELFCDDFADGAAGLGDYLI
jgi:hypothetical protein